MRGLIKVAALLSSTWAAAIVIPNSFASQPSGGVITYKPSEASVQFAIDESDVTSRHPTFEFSVSSSDRPCGETNVTINGQPLESKWEGVEAYGRDFLDIYREREAVWSITCLYSSNPSDSAITTESNVVHLLRLRFDRAPEGFTISYIQGGRASIVRFSPHFIDEAEVISTAREWRQPSIDFDQDPFRDYRTEEEPTTLSNSLWHGSQILLSSVSALRSRLREKILALTGCRYHKAHLPHIKPSAHTIVPHPPLGNETRSTLEVPDTSEMSDSPKPDDLQAAIKTNIQTDESAQYDSTEDEIFPAISQPLESTRTVSYLLAAETRSLHNPEELAHPTSTDGPSLSISTPHFELNYRALKIFGLSLILFSLLLWSLIRCKDPRWRAERAARREEQRTKRLYKIAARKHKIKTFFSSVRTKFLKLKLAGNRAFTWNEKQSRGSEDEESLENDVGNGIQTLAVVQRVESELSAAEEGRNEFDYEAESSQRRRSVSTLPGYESDGGQLPPYEARRSFGIINLVNGVTCISTDIDSNPDSSVVSTSPRISRDGTNSDFDEKFEALSLEQNFRVAVTGDQSCY